LRDFGQVPVLDAKQPGLFQVGHGDPPAALQVQVQPVSSHLSQGAQRFVPLGVLGVGFLREVRHGQAELFGDLPSDDLVGEAVLGAGERSVQCAPQLRHLDEVVEVPGLQARVLAVVDEREQFARPGVQVRGRAQGAHDGRCDQGHGAAAALGGELGQLGEVAAAGLFVGGAAAQAEPERARQVRRVGAVLGVGLAASHIHVDGFWEMARLGRVDDRAAGGRVIRHPGVRQPAVGQRLLLRQRPGLVVADEQVAALVVAAAGVVVAARCVPGPVVVDLCDRPR
jgi:hypothetical protein